MNTSCIYYDSCQIEASNCKSDPYVYDNGTLINKLGITDYDRLNQAEYEILARKVITPETVESSKVDISLIKSIHHYIFSDLFTWAGEFRIVPLYKEELFFIPGISINYTSPEHILVDLKREIYHLNSVRWASLNPNERAKEFATRIARIWKIHPFRDGNTRVVLGFSKIYAIEHEFKFDLSVFTKLLSRPRDNNGQICGLSVRDMFVGASLDEYPEPQYLIKLFRKAMS